MVINLINDYLNGEGLPIPDVFLSHVCSTLGNSFNRQFGEQKQGERKLRLSSIGKCPRQQAYNILGFDTAGKTIDARARMIFFQGDMVEVAITELMKIVGLQVEYQQGELLLEDIPGHPDGILVLDGKRYLLEVKSMSSYSFADFEKGYIDDSYICQINAYLEALGLDECIMIGLNKDAGIMHEHLVRKNPEIVARIKENIKAIKAATKENLPPRAYSPDEKGFLPWQCNYCSFHKICWDKAETVLIKNKYKLKVVDAIK